MALRGLPGGKLCRVLISVLACVAGESSIALAQSGTRPRPVEALFPNVVAMRAGAQQGFGFIAGLRHDTAFIATPLHVVEDNGSKPLDMCFAPTGAACARGRVVYVADAIGKMPAIDLAFVAVPLPRQLSWRPDVEASEVRSGSTVRTIGRSGEWYVSPSSGRVAGIVTATGSFSYTGLDVATGVSGAAVVSDDGIVGMHTQGRGADGADGVLLSAIRTRLENYAPDSWALVPAAKCANEAEARDALNGKSVTVRFLPTGQRTALKAAAQLLCVGAAVTLAPLRSGEKWSGAGVLYPPGALAVARSIQGLLVDAGRMRGVLGTAGNGIEVRIPE